MKKAIHERSHIVWFQLYEMSRISKSLETKQISDGQESGEGRRGMMANGYGGDENVGTTSR